MKKFKIGDKVRIRKDLKVGETYGRLVVLDGFMADQRGKICTIIEVNPINCLVEENPFYWDFEMIEPISELKLIFRGSATILIKDGKKYVAKCEAGDTYDREKGLLVALAKANGYKFQEIQEMIANAEIQGGNKQVREVARRAKIGEYIKLTKASFNFNKIGDVLRVDKCSNCDGIIVYNHSQPRETGYTEDIPWYYLPHEYVVLKNYKPNKE